MLFLTLHVERCAPCLWVAVKQVSFLVPKVGRDIVILCLGGKIPPLLGAMASFDSIILFS